MIRDWLRKRRAERAQHDSLWRPYKVVNDDGLNQFQIEFELKLRQRLGAEVRVDREIEHDCDGQDVLWLTVQPHGLEIAIYDSLIQIAGLHFYEEWDGTPSELIEKASEQVVCEMKDGT